MDFDAAIFLNFFPFISTASLAFITCITVFYKLRIRWPVKVNCWFCNGFTKINRKSMEWWLCPHCEQYNGFSGDGDYNYQIPEQHKTVDYNEKNSSYCQQKDLSFCQNNLCKKCNRNEELKLKKLRELENSVDVSAEQLAQFEKSYDKKYPLCKKCQSSVQNVLFKQNQWLTEYKMLLFKQKSVKRIIKHRQSIERVLHIILSVIASVSIYYSEVSYFPLCGIILQLVACLASTKSKRNLNIFPIFGWICLLWIETFSIPSVLHVFNFDTRNMWMQMSDNSYHLFFFTLGTTICLENLRIQFLKTSFNGSFTFKKLESSKSFTSLSPSPSPVPMPTLFSMKSTDNAEVSISQNLGSPVNITDTIMAPTAIETPIPLKSTNFSDWYSEKNVNSSNSISSRMSSFEAKSDIFPKNYSSRSSIFTPETQTFSNTALSNHNFENESLYSKNFNNHHKSLSDSLTSLNSLSLGSHKKSSSNSPKVFETKIYSTNSSNLFSKCYNQKRSILAPAKLHSMTQTSWVAGGYWQSTYDMPSGSTLSRSSSQSSGFGSSSSNLGVSHEPAALELDQCSIISDQCSFPRPESQLSTRTSFSTTASGNKDIRSLSRFSHANDMSCESESLKCHPKNSTIHCSGHTTVIANPLWVPALLCGSLVFNMLVLCTVLLR